MEFNRNHIENAIREAQVNLAAGDQLWWSIAAESSDFVRLNHAQIRQAGAVEQIEISLRLVRGRKQAESSATVGLDNSTLGTSLRNLRQDVEQIIDHIPDDPFLLLDDHPRQQVSGDEAPSVDAQAAIAAIREAADGLDLVGIWASGWIERGLISSIGHVLWHRTANWSFDWSVYAGGDKAVKDSRGGKTWEPHVIQSALDHARTLVPILERPPKVLEPGNYRTWLAPSAMAGLVGMFNWGGFATRSVKTNTSVLQAVYDGERRFSPLLTLRNDAHAGGSPTFTNTGHALPEQVELVSDGVLKNTLTGARSAAEYAMPINAGGEYASDLVCAPGDLADDDILTRLGTGIHMADCWYTNWSERNSARTTGMTRFHSFWVENGEIVAPLSVMRFDDSLIDGFGNRLEALGSRVAVAPETSTYGSRHVGHTAFPGALLSEWSYPL